MHDQQESSAPSPSRGDKFWGGLGVALLVLAVLAGAVQVVFWLHRSGILPFWE